MLQYLQLDNPQWGMPLPPPHDRAITHEPRAELIHEVNPAYLSYWKKLGYESVLVNNRVYLNHLYGEMRILITLDITNDGATSPA